MKNNKIKPTPVLDVRQLEPGVEFASIEDFLGECAHQEPECKAKRLEIERFQEIIGTQWKGKILTQLSK